MKNSLWFMVMLLLGAAPGVVQAESAWDKLKAAAEKMQQQKQPQSQTSPQRQTTRQPSTSRSTASRSAQSAPATIAAPPDFGTAKGTARIADGAGSLGMLGIKLGMGMKEALSALKSHRSDLKAQPLNLYQYEALPGVTMTPVVVAKTDKYAKAYEFISLEFTYSPSDAYVWSISRDIAFTYETAPPKDNVVADLRKKYGPESFLLTNDQYVWIFDAQGSHVANPTAKNVFSKCSANVWNAGMQSISAGGNSPTHDNHLGNSWYDQQLKKSYYLSSYGKDHSGGVCQSHSVIQVRLPELSARGQAQGLIRGMIIRVSNRQLEASGVQASHAQLMQAVNALENKRAGEAAKRSGPKL